MPTMTAGSREQTTDAGLRDDGRPPSTLVAEIRDARLRLGGETIYDGLGFTVEAGDFLCILGPSGCGKSTLLRVFGDLLSLESGFVAVNGKPPALAWSDIAFVFQSPRLAPWRNILDNVLLGVELRFGRREAKARTGRARDLLKLVGLSDAADKYPPMLSGGERQRVAIARALATEPSVILMDEPFSALDPNTRRRLRGEIERIWATTGATVIFVTHDIDEALLLATRVVLLSGKPTRVLEQLRLGEARPRDLAADPSLAERRRHLQSLFRAMEPADPEEIRDEAT